MRLGILSDIHESTDYLQAILHQQQQQGVDQFVVLGDIYDSGKQLTETVQLLRSIPKIGVWGNHDLGLCLDPSLAIQQRYGDVLDFFAGLKGRVEIEDCFFCHFQSWMDPTDIEQPWYLHDLPSDLESIQKNFAATSQRVIFQGHYHRAFLATESGPIDWDRDEQILDQPTRYLVVVPAVCDGWSVWYDTQTYQLHKQRI